MTLLADIARCPGFGDGPEDWLLECTDCQRRTAPPGRQTMAPPAIVMFWCESFIPPEQPEDDPSDPYRLAPARRAGGG